MRGGVAGSLRLVCALVCLAAWPATAENAGLVLREDFEAGGFSPDGGLFYKDGREQRVGTYEFQRSTVYRGHGALSLSVRPACPPAETSCAERAEVWERPDRLAGYDETVWYGFAFRLAAPIPQDEDRYVLAQWKREILPGADKDYSPFLALRLFRGRLGITVESDLVEAFPIGSNQRPKGCLPGEALVFTRADWQQSRALVATEAGPLAPAYPAAFNSCAPSIRVVRHGDLPAADSGWIDLVVRSSPGPDGSGRIEIIANGRPVASVSGRIGHSGPGLDKNQYFKFGPYRDPRPEHWTVHYDHFRRGPRCTDVIDAGQCPEE